MFNIVDTFFISLLGTEPLAAVSFTFPVTFTVISLAIGLGIGTSAVIAKALGSNNIEEARFDASMALLIAVVMVVCLSLFGYLLIAPIFKLLGAGGCCTAIDPRLYECVVFRQCIFNNAHGRKFSIACQRRH
ncbi:hypothetical protein KAN5_16400 [Pseudoalteromonas sp. KAN5]|nr:hypothetical protein KAN5_16400 [Pseudoalteromonas sp. KAN5]